MIIQSLLKFLKQVSYATDRLMEVTMLILKPSARLSTSVPAMGRAASPSTASSVPMEPSSTRTTSSAIGGSTLTALLLKASMPETWKLKLKDKTTKDNLT